MLIGTQYYRYPTPEPGQWERDILHAKALGLDFIQLRPQWRVHERIEGKYEWADLDGLFELCRKHSMKLIFKFLLETGPQWLFDKYCAFRIAPDGNVLTPYSNGSFYVGGAIPCFDHPVVREKASAFVKAAVERYQSSKELLYWHLWNEPRNRPFGECACGHSLRLYQQWLEREFGTIEAYNSKLGLAEGAFIEIKPPPSGANYTTAALWKRFCRERVAERLNLVAKAVRKVDKKRPLMTHVGMCSPLQDILNDGSDDVLNAQETDVYGCSLVYWTGEFHSFAKQEGVASFTEKDWQDHYHIFALQADWLRAIKKEFWISEFYANPYGRTMPSFTADDIRLRLYEMAGSGAKGINLWQFRPELLCNEAGALGLVNLDGTDNERALELKKFNEFRKAHAELLDGYVKDKGDVAIVYDLESDMASRLEDTEGVVGVGTVGYRYKKALKAWHSTLWQAGLNVDFIPSQEFEKISEYKAVVVPYMTRMTEKQAALLEKFVRCGGKAFVEPGAGIRDGRNWMREVPIFSGAVISTMKFPGFKPFFKAKGLVIVKRGKSRNQEVIFILNYENKKVPVDIPSWKKRVVMGKREVKVLWR